MEFRYLYLCNMIIINLKIYKMKKNATLIFNIRFNPLQFRILVTRRIRPWKMIENVDSTGEY